MSVPSELEDALSRLNSTVEDYALLQQEMDKFLYRYVGGMIKGFNPTTGNFVLQLRHPKESIVSGRPKVLTVQIAEHLRSVLDYVVFELSAKNNPGLNKRQPQFVMADDRATFKKESKRRLRHLKDVERTFVEQLQPYHGNWILRVMRDPTGKSKHRRLLSVRDMTSLDIVFGEAHKQDQYKNWWMYPQDKGSAIFARPKKQPVLLTQIIHGTC